ncbi:MAG: MauE/DoxX family redox-associated membrane protein [Planctomycetota bacterium]
MKTSYNQRISVPVRKNGHKIAKTILAIYILATGILKWFSSESFPESGSFPKGLLLLASVVEVLLGATLLSRFWRFGAWGTVFWGQSLVVYLLWNGPGFQSSSCGCFGPLEIPYSRHFLLLFGMILLALSILLGNNESVSAVKKSSD